VTKHPSTVRWCGWAVNLYTYLFMTDIDARALDRELERGSAQLLILSLLDARARHDYELSKLIHTGPAGSLRSASIRSIRWLASRVYPGCVYTSLLVNSEAARLRLTGHAGFAASTCPVTTLRLRVAGVN
jgi:hypothetical protein